jgi:dihydrofolate synthase/folylpolyglutamate synthase
MTYQEARQFIDQSARYGCVPGLETIKELMERLGNPQEGLKIIHVAGTNGKGSVSAFIAAILTSAGYFVGRYLSPAVFSYRERIQTMAGDSSQFITRQGVCDAIAQIKPVCETMVSEGLSHPTSFEIETAMAMYYLSKQHVDFAVVEVGLGGKLDATNIITHPVCCVITSISMDHMQFLGNTLTEIATQKAGIIKENSTMVTCRQKPEVIEVLLKTCQEKNVMFYLSDSEDAKDITYSLDETTFSLHQSGREECYTIRLLGEYQIENAMIAITVARALHDLGYAVGESAIKNGLSNARWRGRFEKIAENPDIIIDGAHNEDAARRLRKSIEIYCANRRIIYILGVLADKDYQSILKITAPLADVIITLTPDNTRALPSSQLAMEAKNYCSKVVDANRVDQAVVMALREAEPEDVIIAFGSLSYLGDLVHASANGKEEETYDR